MIVPQQAPRQFMREACETVITNRLKPFDQVRLQQHLRRLDELMQERNDQSSLYLEVSVQLKGRLEAVKIEQWSFTVVSARQHTFQGLASIESSDEHQELRERQDQQRLPLTELVRIMSSKNISLNNCQWTVLSTDFILTFDRELLSALEVQNTFEVVIDSFESRQHSYSINLMYNYEVEQEQDEFVILTPEPVKQNQLMDRFREAGKYMATEAEATDQPKVEANIRKYSEGLEGVVTHTFSRKVSPLDQGKLQLIQNRLKQIQFEKIDHRTSTEIIDWVLQ